MPLITVKMIEEVFTPAQKQEIITKLTDALVSVEGESLRPYTVVLLEDIKSGDWSVGGKSLKTADVHALQGVKSEARPQSRRAASLADRIEEGAASLAAFAEGLSENEWRIPLSMNGRDRRQVGVVVHHVASMYPIEIEAARAIAGGKAVTDVTWDVVAEINAKHAREYAGVTKSAALELLRKNSKEAAAAVRSLTDKQLDTAAPFSLSYGAPVTAQFVIEDHAMRHSWHHLARMRAVLGR
jgi:4-oxalocrotonate tautomerase family enzyme